MAILLFGQHLAGKDAGIQMYIMCSDIGRALAFFGGLNETKKVLSTRIYMNKHTVHFCGDIHIFFTHGIKLGFMNFKESTMLEETFISALG